MLWTKVDCEQNVPSRLKVIPSEQTHDAAAAQTLNVSSGEGCFRCGRKRLTYLKKNKFN